MSARKHFQSGFFLPIVIAVVIAFAAGFFVQTFLQSSNLKDTFSTASSLNKKEEPKAISLPKDLVKISGCIPFEGEHYVRPQDVPHGPFYVIYNGKLTAIEYMFEPSEVPGENYAKMSFPELIDSMQKNKLALKDIVDELQTLSFSLPSGNYTYSDLHWTAPHAGVLHPHFDLHFYLQSKEEMKNVCPESTLQDVLPEDLVKDLINSGVPLPQ